MTFDAADGLKLHYEWTPPAGPARGTVLIVHGYADHGGRYRHVAQRLAEKGLGVMSYDCRGHGRSEGRRGHIDRFDEYVSDFERALGKARELGGGKPVGIVAHSHGALITLRAFVERDHDIVGAVLSSPFFGVKVKVSPLKLVAARVTSKLLPTLTMSNNIPSRDLTRDAALVAEHERDGLCHKVATARWFTEATNAMAHVLAHASSVKVPTLWMIAGADAIVDAAAARKVYERAGGDKRLIDYPEHYHENFNETDREQVLGEVVSWLSPRFPSA